MAEASDFIFGMQMGFAKAHYKILPRIKKCACPWVIGAAQYFEFPINIYAVAEASGFTFGTELVQLGPS